MKNHASDEIARPLAAARASAVRRAQRRVFAALLCVSALAACATTGQDTRDQLIPQRAQARWDALLSADYAAAYAYASPGYRSSNSLADFEIEVRSRRVQYTAAEYREHRCEEAVCTVKVSVDYRVVRPVAGVPEWKSSSVVEERWVYSAGEWWFLPQK